MEFIFYDSCHIIDLISDFLVLQKLLKQGYVVPRWKSSLQNFYGNHHELVVCSQYPFHPF